MKGATPYISPLSFHGSAGNGWWWVPVVAPMVGAILGTAVYYLLVSLHHPEDSEPAKDAKPAPHKVPAQTLECKL